MKLKSTCSICNKPLELKSEVLIGTEGYLRGYKCGHSFWESASPEPSEVLEYDFTSNNGQKAAYPYQQDGVRFIEKTGFNCIIADPMGLGKTIQALLAAREAENPDGSPKFKSILGIVKPNTIYQWYEESKEWFDPGLWSVFRIDGTKGFIPPGFRLYLLSMDTLSRFMSKKNGGLSTLKSLGIDLVIVDECHSFKNTESARSKALVEFLQLIGTEIREVELKYHCRHCELEWQEVKEIAFDLRRNVATETKWSRCPQCGRSFAQAEKIEADKKVGLILLSGTPIKSRADEYFIPLNLIRPDIFTSQAHFRRRWLQKDDNNKWTRIHPYMKEEFDKLTSHFILRREKNEVLDLPPFRRTFETIYVEDETLKTQYNLALADLATKARNLHKLSYFDVKENLMTLRRITGMAKVSFAVEYIDTFLDTTEKEKIAIGIMHDGVRDAIFYALSKRGIPVLKYSGEDSTEQKNRTQKLFQTSPEHRVIIINMVSGGVGLNLQACNNILCLERMWTAADEEQFEGRFWRNGQTLPVLAEYMLAHGTIDAWTSALVEHKRQVCGETLDGWDFQSDPQLLRDLVEKIISHKL